MHIPKKYKIIMSIFGLMVISLIITLSVIFSIKHHNKKSESNISKYNINEIFGEKTKNYNEYFISFNESLILPNYALYNLNGYSSRCKKDYPFYADPELNTRTPQSFTNTKYDRGHLVPASKNINDSCSTFSMANIVPQIPCFNQDIWVKIEDHVVETYRNQNILTVPDYDYTKYIYDNYGQILFVPIGFYKIVFDINYENILFSIYLNHTNNICNASWEIVGDFNKLPYFVTFGIR
jgi:DNA/RNA endonuclease G (NUC1)